MRTDVKLGLVVSVLVILLSGWYFTDLNQPGDAISTVSIDDPEPLLTLATPSSSTHISKPLRRATPPPPLPESPPQDPPFSGAPQGSAPVSPSSTPAIADLLKVKTDLDTAFDEKAFSGDPQGSAPTPQSAIPDPQSAIRNPQSSIVNHQSSIVSPPSRMETHTVKPGDTMLSIARIYYGHTRSVRELINANPQLADPSRLSVGTIINIPDLQTVQPAVDPQPLPGANAAVTARKRGTSYTVVEGDTLYSIALNQLSVGSRWTEIHQLNKGAIGDDPAALKVGLVLTLPP